ncbi:NAD-dependent succinate-semialdehyde dehydrogenase [Hydrogenophaga sp.]|jgi:succinate-semialdehyde dehydrogenase/glutarate-semialdehyde dehydrogenase|uniref:NAD-dependent succinate-semialdehyde dehydrogenase n=1 Tax=Hydrogenophaga sp. TaxID=1904254 RepID=UPI003F6FDF8D
MTDVRPDDQAHNPFDKLALLIDGAWTRGTSGKEEPVINPATGQMLGMLPHASAADIEAAVQAAQRGFLVWSRVPAMERRRVLLEAARLLRERTPWLAQVLTLEEGKTLDESRAELASAIDVFEWYAEETRRLYGRLVPSRQAGVVQAVAQEPIGIAAAFTPWNFPALTPARKIAGAIAAGCSCVIKASEETPATCMALATACMDAGLPPGVLNVVFGVPSEVSQALLEHPLVRKVSFTGSIAVGKHLSMQAAVHGMKRCTMELGGHAPVIVFEDADVDRAADICAAGRFRNAGQVCVAPSRFYVQRSAYGRFVDRFGQAADRLVLGDGLEKTTTMGPLASERRMSVMKSFVEDALAHGARVVSGGSAMPREGFFWRPTVLADVPDEARAMREETFGPIAPIAPFDTMEEVLERANALPFGLAAFVFTRSGHKAAQVSSGLAAGMVGVNHLGISIAEAPFGGVKESGIGSEGGVEGLQAYLVTKFVSSMQT